MLPDELTRLVTSRDTADRIKGMQRLARSPGPEAQPYLVQGLSDKSKFVAALAAEALGEYADLRAAAEMIAHFDRFSIDGRKLDPGCHIRANLAYAFGKLECLHADQVLLTGIRTVQIEPVGGVPYDTAAHLRGNCALALGKMRCVQALRDITLLLFDDGRGMFGRGDPDMKFIEPRKAAARALGLLCTVEARVPLTLRLRYPHGEAADVIQECMQSLVDLEDPDAPAELMRYVRGEDAGLAVFAGLMLARARADGAELVLRELTETHSGSAREAAILALSSLRTEEADRHLRELAVHDRKAIRDAVRDLGIVAA